MATHRTVVNARQLFLSLSLFFLIIVVGFPDKCRSRSSFCASSPVFILPKHGSMRSPRLCLIQSLFIQLNIDNIQIFQLLIFTGVFANTVVVVCNALQTESSTVETCLLQKEQKSLSLLQMSWAELKRDHSSES